jgi:D-alanyl-D-alanine carboxypeptidase (penicillin-binding protein 5/6)
MRSRDFDDGFPGAGGQEADGREPRRADPRDQDRGGGRQDLGYDDEDGSKGEAPREERAASPEKPRLKSRRVAKSIVGAAAALSLMVAAWAAMGTPGLHGVVSAADATETPTPAASTAPPPPKTLAQTVGATFTIPGKAPSIVWPTQGQAAVTVGGIGPIGTYGHTTTPVPIASVTKTMVAYVVLTDYPLAPGASGPSITVTPAEAAAYPSEKALNQSLVYVKSGEQLTERQALEALMLASADNIAKILARWDAGSVDAFVAKMNAAAASLGMTHTTYTDPSGYSATTVSTAVDQVALGTVAMQNAAFARIVGETSATIPMQGTVTNYNKLLGEDGITGIKTGSTGPAGGCLLFAATFTVGGKTQTLVGAVLGQYLGSGSGFLDPTLTVAHKLIRSVETAVVPATVAAPGTQVGAIQQAGSADVPLGVTSAVSVIGWAGLTYQVSVSGDPSAATLTVTATGSSSPLATSPLTPITTSSGSASPGATSTGSGASDGPTADASGAAATPTG